MKLENLNSLLVEELQDLYSAENQIIEALPDLIEEASSPDLKSALQHHLEETRGQVRRLDQIFSQLPNVKKDGKTCKGMKGIIKDGQDLLDTGGEWGGCTGTLIEVCSCSPSFRCSLK
jgi:ferritin-like metal-binding protein YciE